MSSVASSKQTIRAFSSVLSLIVFMVFLFQLTVTFAMVTWIYSRPPLETQLGSAVPEDSDQVQTGSNQTTSAIDQNSNELRRQQIASLGYGARGNNPPVSSKQEVPYYRFRDSDRWLFQTTMTETLGRQTQTTTSFVTLKVTPLDELTERKGHLGVFRIEADVMQVVSGDLIHGVTSSTGEYQVSSTKFQFEISPEGRLVYVDASAVDYPAFAAMLLLPIVEFPIDYQEQWSTSDVRINQPHSLIGAPSDTATPGPEDSNPVPLANDFCNYRVIRDSDIQLVVQRDIKHQGSIANEVSQLEGGGEVRFDRRLGVVKSFKFEGNHDRLLHNTPIRVAVTVETQFVSTEFPEIPQVGN